MIEGCFGAIEMIREKLWRS